MKRITMFAATITALAVLSGCHMNLGHKVSGSGNRKTEKRTLASFNAINTQGAFSVDVNSQKPASIEIETDDNILPLIRSEVRNDVLYLKSDETYNSRDGVVIHIAMPQLNAVEATGAGMFRIQNLKNDRFEVRATGAVTLIASGEAKGVEVHATGAGLIDVHNLRASTADVSSMGAAKVDVFATDQLDANVAGAAVVTYAGNPKTVNKKTSGAASVRKREENIY
jgi:hypothetical protein